MPPISSTPRATIAVDLRGLVGRPTGIGVYTRSLLLALAREPDLAFVGMAHRPPVEAEELTAAGIRLEHHPAPLGVLWQQLRLPWRLRRGDVDLLWSPITTLPWLGATPAVATVHDLTAILFPRDHTFKVRWSVRPFLRRTLRRAGRIVADSQATARDLARLYPSCREDLEVVPLGVDSEFRPGDASTIAAIRHELGCPEGYLLYAGTIEPRKNVGGLLDAWTELRRERQDVPPLVVAGPPGWHSDAVLARMQRLRAEGLVVTGRLERTQLVRVFQGARIFVYPSLYEGFGLPPAEAMACGIPVIASDSSSLSELVGGVGRLVPPRDVPALRQAILELLEDPVAASRCREAGLRKSATLSWEASAGRMAAIFREVLAGTPGPGARRSAAASSS